MTNKSIVPTPNPFPLWFKHRGVIFFSVTSDGATGDDWIVRLGRQGHSVGYYTRSVLRSPDFKPTSGVTTRVAVLQGRFFAGDDSSILTVRTFAAERDLRTPNAEVACLICEKYASEEIKAMGLMSLIVAHDPISDADGAPSLLQVCQQGDGSRFTYYNAAGINWQPGGHGFVFERGPEADKLLGV